MVLLIPYDPLEPFNNLVTAIKCKPDILLIFGNVKVEATKTEYLQKARQLGLKNTQIRVRTCDIYNLNSMVSVLSECIAEYGAENCILDATGGEERLLFASGYLCKSVSVPVVLYSLLKGTFKCLNGNLPVAFTNPRIRLSVEQRIEINNCQVLRSGHIDSSAMNAEFWEIARKVFFVYIKNKRQWPAFTKYLQQLLQMCDTYAVDGLTFIGPTKFRLNDGHYVRLDNSILKSLLNTGAITDAEIHEGTVRLKCRSYSLQKALMDAGAWLELYLYGQLKQCAEFDDVQLDQVLSWDSVNEHTVNELDLIATSGASVFFISCKTGTLNMNMLYEIKTMAQRFGGRYSIPVLATVCNMVSDAPALLRRAAAMGIVILDAEDLVKKNPAKELLLESQKLLASYSW